MKFITKLFKGRLSRKNYAIGVLINLPLQFLVSLPILAISSIAAFLHLPGFFEIVIDSIILALYILWAFSLSVRRFHDLNKSGWLSLFLLVPIINLVIFIWLLFAHDTTPNKYGDFNNEFHFRKLFLGEN